MTYRENFILDELIGRVWCWLTDNGQGHISSCWSDLSVIDIIHGVWCLVSLTVDLRTIGISDSPIIVDQSPPVGGKVYDGEIAGIDMAYMKDNNKVVRYSKDWLHIYTILKRL